MKWLTSFFDHANRFLPSILYACFFKGLDAGKASSAAWNSVVFVKAVKELAPSLNWVEVIQNFDNPYFNVIDSGAFQVIMMAISAMGLSRESFPIDFLLGKWNNVRAQVGAVLKMLFWVPGFVNVRSLSVQRVIFGVLYCTIQTKFVRSLCLFIGEVCWNKFWERRDATSISRPEGRFCENFGRKFL